MTKRVLLVGLDGATFDIIQPMAAEGRLPTLGRLMRDGAWGTLQSSIPPITPSAWTSVFTGKNAGKHGIYDFQQLDRRTYDFRAVRTDEHREKTLWHLLGEAGKRSIIIDVPFTYPPRPLNGLMLTGYGTPRTPETVFTFPEDFHNLLPPELHSEVRVALPSERFDRSPAFVQEWETVMEGRQRLLKHLLTNESWDFFMVVFSITDNMAHVFWTYLDPAHPNYQRPEAKRYREALLHAYELCDRALGELMAEAGDETTTLVISDHGFGSVRPRQYLYQRLLRGGFLKAGTRSTGLPVREQLVRLAVSTYNRFPFLREWVKGLRPGQRNNLKQTLTRTGIMPTDASIDYARSQVIPTNFGLQMWINDRGRFPTGVVDEDEVVEVLDRLATFLESDVDPATGEPIIARTYRKEELYGGPHAGDGPDLVIEYSNFYRPTEKHPVPNPRLEGGHTPDGVFLACGSDVRCIHIDGARLIDLAPTVLYLLEQPVPPDMDGQVLEEMFTYQRTSRQPVVIGEEPARVDAEGRLAQEYTPAEEAEIREQLRQLGYID